MADLRIGDVVWVNVANQKLWWPGSVISTFPSMLSNQLKEKKGRKNEKQEELIISVGLDNLLHERDFFRGVGCDDLMVVKYLGVEQEKLTALRLTDRGLSWDLLSAHDLKTQLVPTTMQIQYSTAMNILDKRDQKDTGCLPPDEVFKKPFENVPSNEVNVVEQQNDTSDMSDIASSALDHGARNIILTNAAEAYDSEGISSSSLQQENLFEEAIDKNSLKLLDHKCSLNHHHSLTKKRQNVLPWDDYFMSVAFLSAMRSKDPSTQVGACIVNPEKRVVGIGE